MARFGNGVETFPKHIGNDELRRMSCEQVTTQGKRRLRILNQRLIAAILSVIVVLMLSVTPAFAKARHDASTLTAAGSSADAPLFGVAFPAYGHGVQVNYQPLGSGTGQKDLNGGAVDFGCFDVPMLRADGFSNFSKIVQFPVALFGIS